MLVRGGGMNRRHILVGWMVCGYEVVRGGEGVGMHARWERGGFI